MDICLQPDIYSPGIHDNGNYIDKIPSFNILKKGVYCPCGSRKDKIYDSSQKFTTHIKSKIHQKWLESINLEKTNFYVECHKLQEVVNSQKLIIARLEQDVINKSRTIDYLTIQVTSSKNTSRVENLLDFDNIN